MVGGEEEGEGVLGTEDEDRGWEGGWWGSFAVSIDHFGVSLDICSILLRHFTHARLVTNLFYVLVRCPSQRFNESCPSNGSSPLLLGTPINQSKYINALPSHPPPSSPS